MFSTIYMVMSLVGSNFQLHNSVLSVAKRLKRYQLLTEPDGQNISDEYKVNSFISCLFILT